MERQACTSPELIAISTMEFAIIAVQLTTFDCLLQSMNRFEAYIDSGIV